MSLWSLMCIKLRARGKMRLVDEYVHRTYEKTIPHSSVCKFSFTRTYKYLEIFVCLCVLHVVIHQSLMLCVCIEPSIHTPHSTMHTNGTERNERMVMCAIFFVSSQTSIVIRLLILINTECVRDMTVDLL